MTTGHGRLHHHDAYLALLRRTLALCALTFLSACSGGGGGDDDDDGDGGGDDDADASGVWTGPDVRDGGGSAQTVVIVSETGAFGSVSVHQTLSGSGSTSGNSLSATATGWAFLGQTFANGSAVADFTLNGTVDDFTRMDATYSGGNSSGTLTLTYDLGQSALGASDTLVNGTYTNDNGDTLTVTDGDLSFVAGPEPACTGSGTITFENGGKNIYDWDITLSGCSIVNGAASGVAMVTDSSSGSNDALYMVGQVGNFPWVTLLSK